MSVVSDDQIHDALEYLNSSITDAATAGANFNYMNEYRKVVLAECQHDAHANGFGKMTMAEREMEGRISNVYKAHLTAQRDAEFLYKEHQFRTVAALAVIQAWQTQSANERGAAKII